MVRGTIQGQRNIVLIDCGKTHNFIDVALVKKMGIPTEDFEGFDVTVADGYNITYTHKVPRLDVTFDNYTLIVYFYIVDLANNNMRLEV